MLGHLYAAEALVLLDKISDAIGHLNPEHVKELTLLAPSTEKDIDREKADIGTEQHTPLKGEAESTQHNQVMHSCAGAVSHMKAVLCAVLSNSICCVCSVVPKHTRDSWSGDTVQPGSCICYPW
jgi:hypothetical protein